MIILSYSIIYRLELIFVFIQFSRCSGCDLFGCTYGSIGLLHVWYIAIKKESIAAITNWFDWYKCFAGKVNEWDQSAFLISSLSSQIISQSSNFDGDVIKTLQSLSKNNSWCIFVIFGMLFRVIWGYLWHWFQKYKICKHFLTIHF